MRRGGSDQRAKGAQERRRDLGTPSTPNRAASRATMQSESADLREGSRESTIIDKTRSFPGKWCFWRLRTAGTTTVEIALRGPPVGLRKPLRILEGWS
jgi:hypothetical protein